MNFASSPFFSGTTKARHRSPTPSALSASVTQALNRVPWPKPAMSDGCGGHGVYHVSPSIMCSTFMVHRGTHDINQLWLVPSWWSMHQGHPSSALVPPSYQTPFSASNPATSPSHRSTSPPPGSPGPPWRRPRRRGRGPPLPVANLGTAQGAQRGTWTREWTRQVSGE